MMNLRLSKVATAARAILTVRLDPATREAALKIPIKDAHREIAVTLRQRLDDLIGQGIAHCLGRGIEEGDDIGARLSVRGAPDGMEGEVYLWDDAPIVWCGPLTVTRVGDEMRGDMPMRRLWA